MSTIRYRCPPPNPSPLAGYKGGRQGNESCDFVCLVLRVSVGQVRGSLIYLGLMQPQPPHRIFFLFVAMQSALPPEGISIRYAYACPFNGGKQAKKEYRLRKKNTLYYSAASQRKTKWM